MAHDDKGGTYEMRTSPVLMLTVVPLLALVMAGCGGGTDPAPPTITGASVSPTELRFTGGDVTITATVDAPAGVGQVRATAGATEVPLTPDGAQYEGVFTVPPNEGNTAAAYTVTVTATDTEGRTSEPFATGTITVRAAERPHDPPSGW